MPAPSSPPLDPAPGERGLASWEPADVAGLVLPAWDEFLQLAAEIDLDAPTRLDGWSARAVCVHLGSWPGSRSFQRLREEAERDDLGDDPSSDHRASTFDQDAHNDAVVAARGLAPRADLLAALREARGDVADFLASDDAGRLGRRQVRSVLGPLPLTTLVAAGAYELAVHTLDLAPAGAPPPSADLLSAGVAALVDTTGALAARCELSAAAGCVAPEGGWAFSAAPGAWSTVELPVVPGGWAVVQGRAADILDASAGRRAVPPMLARRDLRLHQVTGLLALAPIVEAVPGLPGGSALRSAVRNVRGLSRLVRRIPGLPG
ncbi:MAG: maleylpyruvate isomerase N-terminal domain-containing protein [Sporichthyaceae bacterium]